MRTIFTWRSISRVALGTILLLCSCTTTRYSRRFSSEYEHISSCLHPKAQDTTNEVAPTRDRDSWRAEGEYEFGSAMNSTMEIVRSCVPSEYQRVGESMGELNYARQENGDTFYLTLHLTPDTTSKTRVRFLLKSLPS